MMILNPKHLKNLWSGFNHWRKRYWFTRTLVLLIIFSPILYEKLSRDILICDLIRIACDGIFASSIPQSEFSLCRFYKFQEKRRLQRAIINYADKNQNGVLEFKEIVHLYDMGCDVKEIEKSPTELDLDKLAHNADLLGLLPPSYSTKAIRMKAFYAAHAENDFFYTPLTDEVYDIIDRQNWLIPRFTDEQKEQLKLYHSEEALSDGTVIPDYAKWGTWRNGIEFFLNTFTWTFYPFLPLISWFSISILISIFSSLTVSKFKRIIAVSASLIFLGLILYSRGLNAVDRFWSSYVLWNYFAYISQVFSLCCFSIIAGLTGYKISRCIKNQKFWRVIILLAIGIALLWWNRGITQPSSFWWFPRGVGDLVKASSFLSYKTVYNEVFVLSILIMILSLYMGVRYWIEYKISRRDLEKDKRG